MRRVSNTVSFNLDKDLDAQISKIVISGSCDERYPCQHSCTITFADGQSIKTGLNGYDARALTLAIKCDKFSYDSETEHNPADHFKDYDVSKWGNISAKQVIANILK